MMAEPAALEGARLISHPLGLAVVEVINERGYELASVEEFLARAGIGREEFDRNFSGKAEVTRRVYEAFAADFVGCVQAAYDAAGPWPASLRAAAYEVTRWMADHPAVTRFGNVGMLEAPELGRVRREELFRWCAGLIDAGRALAPDPDAVPAAAPLIAVGSVAEISRRHQEGSLAGDPVAMVPELMYAAVRPYLGEEAARRELAVPPPADLSPAERARGGG